MAVYYLFNVWHCAVAEFDGIAVEEFMKLVRRWEAVVEYGEEFLSYICSHVLAERGIEPGDIAFPIAFSVAGVGSLLDWVVL